MNLLARWTFQMNSQEMSPEGGFAVIALDTPPIISFMYDAHKAIAYPSIVYYIFLGESS